MAKSDDGHYELVLGNRQLVSGFFVLVILFAIFLTLGYILGRNSVVVNETDMVAGGTRPSPGETVAPETVRPVATPSGERPSAAAEEVSETPQERAVAVSEAPAKREPSESTPTPVTKPAVNPSTTAPSQSTATTPRAQEILNSKVKLITPRKGDVFLQVAAIGRSESEVMGEQLQKRGYRVFLSEVPTKDLFRVLIGPFDTTARLSEMKKKLADEGLPSIVQRY